MLGALRVMRPPAVWSPLDLADLVAWHDATDTGSITESGGLVQVWGDLSGNAYDLVQNTAGERPGLATIGGLNAIDLVGANHDWMQSGFGSNLAPFTLYCVVQLDLTSTAMTIIQGTGSFGSSLQVSNSGGYKWMFGDGGGANIYGPVVDTAVTVVCLVNRRVADWNSSNSIYVNSTSGTTAGMFGGPVGGLQLAGGYWGGGDCSLGEIIVCSTAHDATTRATAMNGLGSKWGATIS